MATTLISPYFPPLSLPHALPIFVTIWSNPAVVSSSMERKTPAPALLTRTSIPSCSPAADVIVICNACASALSQRSARILCAPRSEEHTSELQSLMRISYAVFCLKKQKTNIKYQDQLYYTIIINRQ